MRTLIVAPNWIGDALMAQPLFALLRAADPAGELVTLAPEWVAPVLEAMPEIDRVLPTRLAHGTLQWTARRQLARALRAAGYQRAIVLPNSLKSALLPWLARIPERLGYLGEQRYGLLNRRLAPPPAALAMRHRYAALAGLAGVAVPATLPAPRLALPASAGAAARARFGLPERFIALCPGAEFGPAKSWPARHHATLARDLAARHPDVALALLGGPGDAAIAAEIVALAGPGVPLLQLAGQTSLAEALALIGAASAVVSNDSGLMHVAAALGTPQAAIFGSSDPRHTPPLSPKAEILWLRLECSPCFERTCPLGHLRCLEDLTPASVAQRLEGVLTAAGP